MSLLLLVDNIKSFLEHMEKDHKPYLDHVWIGKPAKLPMGGKRVAFIEIISEPTFHHTTCPGIAGSDVEVYITVLSKGYVERAHIALYRFIDAFKTAWMNNNKFDDACIGSTIEEIEYGDLAEGGEKLLVTGARILLKCRL